jgi:two-component system cell cycle sensor histidine kinase/response regulator CckA
MFSRRQPVRVEVLDLNEVVTALSGLLQRVLGSRVTVQTALSPHPVTVRADRSHLEQVVMNLAVNARDAMPDGGTLTVGTTIECTPDGKPHFARLTITDTGVGMTDEVKARLFEPFFTTKGPDKGTGLGLATVFGIVQHAGGRIEVESILGAGATFRVLLPWCEDAPAGLTRTPVSPVATRSAKRGVSVLLVEDQEAVRKFARLALRHHGHEVCDADSGESAMTILAGGRHFDVLVTDVTMPGIDGRELAARVRALQPGIAIVLMSGYAPDAEHIDPIERSVFLAKPFPPNELLAAMEKALQVATHAEPRGPGRPVARLACI